ncbi:MAG: hypothetical protein WC087_02260 [Candidatus Paceibacterota bacterium]
MKKPSISTTIIFIIILLAVVGLIFLNKPKQTEAPTDSAPETQNTAASTTSTTNTQVNTATNPDTPVSSQPTTPGTQVIYGDGVVTTITQTGGPTGEAPIIESFVLDNPGSAVCRFSWDVRKAKTCNFVNVSTKMQVDAVNDEGIIQTSEKGDYQLKCYGDGGKITTSSVVSCK